MTRETIANMHLLAAKLESRLADKTNTSDPEIRLVAVAELKVLLVALRAMIAMMDADGEVA